MPNADRVPDAACRTPSEHPAKARLRRARLHPARGTRHAAFAPAFTMIEIITAIAIVILLMAIFAFAFRHVGSSAQRNQTSSLLEQMRNADAELTNTHDGADRFYRRVIPQIFRSAQGAANTPWYAVKAAPASLADWQNDTYRVLIAIQSNPGAKAIIDSLPADRKKRVDGIVLDVASSPPSTPQSVIVPLDTWGNPLLFVFDNWQESIGGGGAKPMVDPTSTAKPPRTAGGLVGLTSASAGGTFPSLTDPTEPLRAPDHLPFWVSAGPDGKYETHDDNVYSFEGQ